MDSIPTSKRKDERFPILALVRYRLIWSPDGSKPEAELHNGNNVIWNISRTGLFLATKNYTEIKSLIEVEFPLEEFKVTLKAEAEVVRANHFNNPNLGKYEYGIRFTKITEEAAKILDKFISLIESKK
jgi:c-di-GMP-binding flagellar brake protein YcgR